MPKKRTTTPLRGLPSLSLAQLAHRWGTTETYVADCIRTGVLQGYLLLHDTEASIATKRSRRSIQLSGHYPLTHDSAVQLLKLSIDDDLDEDVTVLLNDPPGAEAEIEEYSSPPSRKDLRILSEEIERFERTLWPDRDTPRPGRASDFHRERCRAIATLLWEQDTDLTIESLLGRDEITRIAQEGVSYTAKTVRDWVKDLCPNRKPGRRPKNSR